MSPPRRAGLLAALCAGASACGLNVQSPDLFSLTRTGEGTRLSLLVSDGGTIRCNGGPSRALADPLLLQARDLAASLDKDAKAHLSLPADARAVYRFTVRLQDGTIAFPDTAAAAHHELSGLELFTLRAAQDACQRTGG